MTPDAAAILAECSRLARETIALRQAAEQELREMRALTPNHTYTEFECELVRTAFKAGAVFGVKRHSSCN